MLNTKIIQTRAFAILSAWIEAKIVDRQSKITRSKYMRSSFTNVYLKIVYSTFINNCKFGQVFFKIFRLSSWRFWTVDTNGNWKSIIKYLSLNIRCIKFVLIEIVLMVNIFSSVFAYFICINVACFLHIQRV